MEVMPLDRALTIVERQISHDRHLNTCTHRRNPRSPVVCQVPSAQGEARGGGCGAERGRSSQDGGKRGLGDGGWETEQTERTRGRKLKTGYLCSKGGGVRRGRRSPGLQPALNFTAGEAPATVGLSAQPWSEKRASAPLRVTFPARSEVQHLGVFFQQTA